MPKFGRISPKFTGRPAEVLPPSNRNGYVTDLSSHDGCVHTTQRRRKPLPATLSHARRPRDGPVWRNHSIFALRLSPTRPSLYTKRRLRALRVCSCTSKHVPRHILPTPNARRVGCHVCLKLRLLFIKWCVPHQRGRTNKYRDQARYTCRAG